MDVFLGMKKKEVELTDHITIIALAEIMMICAALLLFFVLLDLPFTIATGGALFVIFTGSVIFWKNTVVAEIAFFFSLFISQFVLFGYFQWLIIPFILVDIATIFVFTKIFYSHDE